ncbi:MAG: ribosomal protein S18-alanine N-acetyltransferase [Blastocatellia bacterium]
MKDLPAVVQLEQDAGLSSWGIAGYERELLNSQAVLLGLSCLEGDFLLGFFSGRITADEAEILNLVINPNFRQGGLGGRLLIAAMAELSKHGMQTCWLEVRAQNLAAIRLYEKCGFGLVGRRRNYYQNPTEDALIMRWRDDSSGLDSLTANH